MTLGGLVTALRTLTALPAPGPEAEDRAAALIWFPAVGALIGLVLFGAASLMDIAAKALPRAAEPWPEAVGFILVLLGAALTRGIHLDGLADWADADGSMKERSEALRIMKDPHLGSFGVIALLAVLGGKWVALTRLAENGTLQLVIAACVVSRAAQVELAASLPYARQEGGTAASFVTGARLVHRAAAWALALLALAPLGPLAILSAPLGLVLARALGGRFRRRFGGVTGDLLGATSEIAETALLLAFAALGGNMPPWLAGWS